MRTQKIILLIFIPGWFVLSMPTDASAVQHNKSLQQSEALQRTEKEELQLQIIALIEQINADDRDTRRRAVAELAFYADDPQVIARLLALLADARGDVLSAAGRINAMYVLLQTTPEAWTVPLLQRATDVLELVEERDLPLAGPQQRQYIEDLTEFVRRIEAASAPSVGYGVVQERTLETTALTDVDVFVCSGAEDLGPAFELATLLADREFGQVRLRELTPGIVSNIDGLEGHTTVFFDAGQPEENEVSRVEGAVKDIEGLPPFRAEANQDAPTDWYLSVFICPSTGLTHGDLTEVAPDVPLSASFETAMDFVLKWEDDRRSHSQDPSFRYNKGINQTSYDAYRHAHGKPLRDISEIADSEVFDIYRENYWNPSHAPDMPTQALALAVFDTAVQMGASRANRILNEAVGLPAHTEFGPQTEETLLLQVPRDIAKRLLAIRLDVYKAMAAQNSVFVKFLPFWNNRVRALETAMEHLHDSPN